MNALEFCFGIRFFFFFFFFRVSASQELLALRNNNQRFLRILRMLLRAFIDIHVAITELNIRSLHVYG